MKFLVAKTNDLLITNRNQKSRSIFEKIVRLKLVQLNFCWIASFIKLCTFPTTIKLMKQLKCVKIIVNKIHLFDNQCTHNQRSLLTANNKSEQQNLDCHRQDSSCLKQLNAVQLNSVFTRTLSYHQQLAFQFTPDLLKAKCNRTFALTTVQCSYEK